MRVSEQIKEILRHNNLTVTDLANLMHTSQANMANKLARDNFRISEVTEMLVAMGYHDSQVIARDNNETVIISSYGVDFRRHNKYMVFDENRSILDEIKENGFRDKQFKDLVLDLMEEYMRPKFGDLWDTYVPKEFEEGFKQVIHDKLLPEEFISSLYKPKED